MFNSLKQKWSNRENRNVLIYMLSDLLAKGIPFLLIPFYTLYLTPEQFGSIAVFNIIVEIMIIFVVMGGNTYFRVEYFKTKQQSSLFGSVFINLVVTLPIALLLMFLFVLFDLDPTQHSAFWLYAAVLIALTQSIILLVLAFLQCKGQALYVGLLNLLSAAVSGILTVYFLSLEYLDEARYIAYLFTSILIMCISLFVYKRTNKNWPKLNTEQSKPALKFGLGVLPHALSWWARTGMDRMIIAKFVSVHQVGLYSIAAQLSLIVIVFSNAVNQAFTPKIMKMLSENQFSQTVLLCFKVIFGYMIICILLALSAPLIFDLLIDVKFEQAKSLLPLMCAVAFFQATVTLFSNFLYFFKRVKLLSSITFFSSALHVILAWFLVGNYGVNGVIGSSIATYLLSSILIIIFSLSSIKRGQNA
ncbi:MULTISPECIES: lipopolysaccharide biosynthesis protein [unclassified Pseudoalteromonas]|uniref:lipopolysaccharide biosynthesis protein n=1 Tax=unclassified Pseudoalteromonas TaxID=194690 RepID=UPI0005A9BB68|nr:MULTISPECIES: oligosaccharide flippase family protein [unclassified Pseudoalteromonas]